MLNIMPNTVAIDLNKIDSEIAGLELEIEKIKTEIDFRKNLKKYILGQGLLFKNSQETQATKQPIVHSNSLFNGITITPAQPDLGISDFIFKFLEANGKKESRTIIQAYADYTKKSFDEVRNNVSNALSRLKGNNKIDNEYNGGEWRGYGWYIK